MHPEASQAKFTASAEMIDGQIIDITALANWVVDSPFGLKMDDIAAPVSAGEFSTTGLGSRTITIGYAGKSASAGLVIAASKLVSIEIKPKGDNTRIYLVQDFVATGVFSDRSTKDLTVEAKWTSSDQAIAEILNDSEKSGQLRLKKAGHVKISAQFGEEVGAAEVNIPDISMTELRIEPASPYACAGSSTPLTVFGKYADGVEVDMTSAVDWQEVDTDVVQISREAGSKGVAKTSESGATVVKALLPTALGNLSDEVTFLSVDGLSLVKPVGGELFYLESANEISWASCGDTPPSGKLKIEFSDNSGTSFSSLIEIDEKDGKWNWTPASLTEIGRIQISRTSDAAVSAKSQSDFSVRAPFINLTSHNDSPTWAWGSSKIISWGSGGVTGDIVIELSRNNGTSWVELGRTSSGTFNYTAVQAPATSQGILRVKSAALPEIFDMSDGNITISVPTLSVTAPNGGEVLNIDEASTVSWSAPGMPSTATIKIELSKDGGTSWLLVTAAVLNTGSYSFTPVSSHSSDQALIRISAAAEPTITDVSDANFSVVSALGFQTATSTAAESVGTKTVRVSRGSTGTAASVEYAVTAGTAGSPGDFTLADGTLNFGSSDAHKDITVTIADDAVFEPNETIVITLSNPSAGLVLSSIDEHTLTIQDDDALTVQFSTASATKAENASPATYDIVAQMNRASSSNTTVSYTVSGTATGSGTDYSGVTSGTLTFNAGETSKILTLTLVNDSVVEGNETVILTLSNPSQGILGTNQALTLTIQDNDASSISFSSASSNVAENVAGGTATLTVELDQAAVGTVGVSYAVTSGTATGSGTDYTLASGSLSFLNGQLTKNIIVQVHDDNFYDGNETVIVTLSSPTGNAALGATTAHTLTIQDNESSPVITLTSHDSGTTVYTGATNSTDITWTASGTFAPGASIEICLSKNSGSSFSSITSGLSAASGSYSWTPGASDVTAASTALIRVQLAGTNCGDGVVKDTSALAFRIRDPFIAISGPNGGESFVGGESQTISWSAGAMAAGAEIKLELIVGGSVHSTILASIALSSGSTAWTVPNISANNTAKVRATIIDSSPSISDDSDSTFTILTPLAWYRMEGADSVVKDGSNAVTKWKNKITSGLYDLERPSYYCINTWCGSQALTYIDSEANRIPSTSSGYPVIRMNGYGLTTRYPISGRSAWSLVLVMRYANAPAGVDDDGYIHQIPGTSWMYGADFYNAAGADGYWGTTRNYGSQSAVLFGKGVASSAGTTVTSGNVYIEVFSFDGSTNVTRRMNGSNNSYTITNNTAPNLPELESACVLGEPVGDSIFSLGIQTQTYCLNAGYNQYALDGINFQPYYCPNCDFVELRIYDTGLTTPQVQSIECSLATRYGVTVTGC